jgi:hypothetical protein
MPGKKASGSPQKARQASIAASHIKEEDSDVQGSAHVDGADTQMSDASSHARAHIKEEKRAKSAAGDADSHSVTDGKNVSDAASNSKTINAAYAKAVAECTARYPELFSTAALCMASVRVRGGLDVVLTAMKRHRDVAGVQEQV